MHDPRPDTHPHRYRLGGRLLLGVLTVSLLSTALLQATPLAAAAQEQVMRFTTQRSEPTEAARFALDEAEAEVLRLVTEAEEHRRDAEAWRNVARVDSARLTTLRKLQYDAPTDDTPVVLQAGDWQLAYEAVGREHLAEQILSGGSDDAALSERADALDTPPGEVAGDRATPPPAAPPKLDLPDTMTVTRGQLSGMISSLEALRDAHSELAERSEARAATLEERAERRQYSARLAGFRKSTPAPDEVDRDIRWYVAPVRTEDRDRWLPMGGGPFAWDGGTRTPARPPTPVQIGAVLNDPRITIYPGGRYDISNGNVDGRLLDVLSRLAQQYGQVTVTSLISGHSVYTKGGNISAHAYGCAVDIGTVGGVLIEPGSQGPGSFTESVVRFLAGMQGDLAPHQVISLSNIGGPTLAMADHADHIHLGYSC